MTSIDRDLLEQVARALDLPDASKRLQAALAAGTNPVPGAVEVIVRRCGVEPDFFVRDMLTWALTRYPADEVFPLVLAETESPVAQARAQGLHTLSKLADGRAWPAITDESLADADDEAARAAWRAAVALVPTDERADLAGRLAGQLGRGGRDVQLSLSRAFVELGDAAEVALRQAADSGDPAVSLHAQASQRLIRDPDSGFDAAMAEAKRIMALGS